MDCMMKKLIPNGPVLVVMIGPSGAGKSTIVDKYFTANEVVSSDGIREWLTGDFTRQDKNTEVFKEFHHRIKIRLMNGQRVVADATHLKRKDRLETAKIALNNGFKVIYMVVNRPMAEKTITGGWRNNVMIKGVTLIEAHETTFTTNEASILSGDKDQRVTIIDTRVDDFEVILPFNTTDMIKSLKTRGFNSIRVVSDIHGNIKELKTLTTVDTDCFILFLGDLTDTGDCSWGVVDYVYDIISCGKGMMVRGNHDTKMHRYMMSFMRDLTFTGNLSNGMDISIGQFDQMRDGKKYNIAAKVIAIYEMSTNWLEIGDWMFAHASVIPKMFTTTPNIVNSNSYMGHASLYGETDGTLNSEGYPNRTYNWVDTIPSGKNVMVGHQIMSTTAPVVMKTPSDGEVVFLDTGSSKTVNGVLGHLTVALFNITDNLKLTAFERG